MTIKELRDQRAVKAKEARNLLDTNTGEKWSKDIEAQVDAIYADIDRIDGQIERLERQARIDGDAAADDAGIENRNRANHGLSEDERDQRTAYSAAFRNFLVRGERGLTAEEANVLRTGVQNAQSGQQGNGAQGGYLVPTGWGGELLEALKSFGGMRDVATVIQTAMGNPIPWPTVDETAQMGEIVTENTAAGAQDITFGTTQIGAYKWSSKVFTVPIELLMDQGPGIDVEAYIRRAAATRIARIQNNKFTVGTGAGEPTGLVTAAAAGKVGANGQTTSVLPDDLVDLEHSVDPAYRSMPGVGWMFHDTTLRNLKKIKDSQNRPLWLPGYSSKEPDTFLQYEYTINQDMPVMAANAKSILFGDLSQFLIRDVLEVTLFRFDDSAFMTKGQIGFLAWARADGKLVTAGQPVKYYQNSAT
jgi:HK97 family phage major capsid protein